jgi:hypothetical protein
MRAMVKHSRFLWALVASTLLLAGSGSPCLAKEGPTPGEARALAKEAYIYANPVVDNYRVMYGYFADKDNPEFKAPWNQLRNYARVFTSDDRAVQTPNSDTPYSFKGPFSVAMRLYWPKKEALDGTWKAPPLNRVK